MTYTETDIAQALDGFSVAWLPQQGIFVQRGEIKPKQATPKPVVAKPAPIPKEVIIEAHRSLDDLLANDFRALKRREVMDLYFRFTEIPRLEVLSGRRFIPLVRARFKLMWLMKKLTDSSFPEIGRALRLRDHSTIMHGVARVEADIELKHEAEAMMERIMRASA